MTGAREIHRLTPARRDDFLRFFDHDAFPDSPRWQRCYCHWLHADHKTADWPNGTAAQNTTPRDGGGRRVRAEGVGVARHRH